MKAWYAFSPRPASRDERRYTFSDVNWWMPRYALPHGLNGRKADCYLGRLVYVGGPLGAAGLLLVEVLNRGIARRALASAFVASRYN